jgi:hypothetical protein
MTAKPGRSNNGPPLQEENKKIRLQPLRLNVPIQQPFTTGKILITKVTFTLSRPFSNIHFVVWQFWGRAAEAS